MWKARRRRKIETAPFPDSWKKLLEAGCPFYLWLPDKDREELQNHIKVFLAEKNFEGCAGLVITEEIRLCIAATACLLLLHRKTDSYPDLRSVLVYPSTFYVKHTHHLGGGVYDEGRYASAGEAWQHGAVVLAWDQVCFGLKQPTDGYNLVLHEFAHQLDYEDGSANGAPALETSFSLRNRKGRYQKWARILTEAFEQLRAEATSGRESLLDTYGAVNPAEFFAVATEVFFERPREMQERLPQLYEELRGYYQQDPALWHPAAAGTR